MNNGRTIPGNDLVNLAMSPPWRMMPAAWVCAVLATLALPAWPQAPAAPQAAAAHGDEEQMPELELVVGESRVLPAPGVTRIAVGSGQVITANALDGKDVLVFAKGPGTTTLLVWNRSGAYQRTKVNVVASDVGRDVRELAAFLLAIPNTKVTVVGDKVVVEGDRLAEADRDKIAELARRYPLIVNFTSSGRAEPTVTMDVKVVEFPRTQLAELGMKWTAAGGVATGGVWSPGIRGASQPVLRAANLGLNAQLKALEQSGNVAMLAEPQLSTRSGDPTTFHAGGEIPYSVVTANGTAVQFKPYGIRIDIEPRVDPSGVILAVIDSEVSMVDPSVATASGPGLLTRRTRTKFNVAPGETIVLSGLLQRHQGTDIGKAPALGEVPILGALFRSRRYQSRETELVVFVTPQLVNSQGRTQAGPDARPGQAPQAGSGAQAYLDMSLQADRQAGAAPGLRGGSCQMAAALPCPR